MECPNCKKPISEEATECSSCGIIFARYAAMQQKKLEALDSAEDAEPAKEAQDSTTSFVVDNASSAIKNFAHAASEKLKKRLEEDKKIRQRRHKQADAQKANDTLVPQTIYEHLPAMVKRTLATLSTEDQEAFVEEYRRREKSILIPYLVSIIGGHYLYLNKPGIFVLFLLTGAVGLMTLILIPAPITWWLIDLARMPKRVADCNRDLAINIVRDLKILA